MDKIILEIEKLVSGGDGMAFKDGKVHFVDGVLPGERVEVKVIESKKGFNRCKLLNILDGSKERKEPFCKYFNICGGCSMQYTSYDNQVTLKKDIVKDIFKRTGGMELDGFEVIKSKPTGYRNRVQLHSDGHVKGFKAKASDEIVDIDSCPLLVEGLNNAIKEVTLEKGRHTIFSPGNRYFIGGLDKSSRVDILDRTIFFNPKGFFQSNLSILPDLISMVRDNLVGSRFMDLYCGVGFFSSFITPEMGSVIAVEQDSRVKKFIDLNCQDNVEFYNSTLEKFVKKYKGDSFDTIIVDPPRKGLSSEVRSYLLKLKPKRIIYISCDPVTMARDIRELTTNYYDLKRYTLLDFYPQTPHIESFGVLDLV